MDKILRFLGENHPSTFFLILLILLGYISLPILARKQSCHLMAWKIDSDFARYSTLGIQFGVTLLFFGWLGVKLDAWLNSAPWGMLVLGTLGFIAGMYTLVRGARRHEKKGD